MSSILPTAIDISEWQGDVDWDTVKANVWMVILRVQDGTYADKKLQRNVAALERLGIPYYCYGFYRNGGSVEASRMVARAKAVGAVNVKGYVLDVEVSGQSIDGINSAMDTLNMTGLQNGYYIANHLADEYYDKLKGADWRWMPTYGRNDGYPHNQPSRECELWQFTSEGTVPGADGPIDCNALNGDWSVEDFTAGTPVQTVPTNPHIDTSRPDYIVVGDVMQGLAGDGQDRMIALGGKYDYIQGLVNHVLTAPTSLLASEVCDGKYGDGDDRARALGPRYKEVQAAINAQNNKRSNEDVAKAVINGEYGDGESRRRKLEQEGYDYDTIQSLVNKLLCQDASRRSDRYVVATDSDTLSEISLRTGWGNDWQGLARYNGIKNPDVIFPGQKIYY